MVKVGYKCCAKCGREKKANLSGFYSDPGKKDGLSSYCKVCRKRNSRKNLSPLKSRERNLRVNYGMTLEEYHLMFAAQNGLCAICDQPEISCLLSVDHSHDTGKIRGLLCKSCNARLGVLEDSKFRLKAEEYLKGC